MNKNVSVLALLLIMSTSVLAPAWQDSPRGHGGQHEGAAWVELEQGIQRMHAGMHSIQPSGNSDVDFIRLMLPHHQAAIDMARIELVHGNDPQMRRLAQEIITDQQSETELMQLWLSQHKADTQK